MFDITSPIVREAAARFALTPTELTPMAGGHVTSVYEFQRDGTAYVLRIVPPGDESSPEDMRAIHAWVSYLAHNGGPVPRPLAAQNGEELVTIERPEGAYTALASEKARGVRAETLLQADWTETYFRSLGTTAARLHRAAADYKPPDDCRRSDNLATAGFFSPEQPATPIVAERKREVLAQLAELPRSPDRYGMIHGDFHFGNFFVDPDDDYAVTVFDFDDCGYGWYMLDTATLLFDIAVLYEGGDRDEFVAEFLRHYFRGYREVLTIDPAHFAPLHHFLKLLEISYYAMLAPGYDLGQDDDWWVARFMPGRRSRVENGIPYFSFDPVEVLNTVA